MNLETIPLSLGKRFSVIKYLLLENQREILVLFEFDERPTYNSSYNRIRQIRKYDINNIHHRLDNDVPFGFKINLSMERTYNFLTAHNITQLNSKEFSYIHDQPTFSVYSLETGVLNYQIPVLNSNLKAVTLLVGKHDFMLMGYQRVSAGDEITDTGERSSIDLFDSREKRCTTEDILKEDRPAHVDSIAIWNKFHFITNTRVEGHYCTRYFSLWKIYKENDESKCKEMDRIERVSKNSDHLEMLDFEKLLVHGDLLFSSTPRRITIYKIVEEHIVHYRQFGENAFNPLGNFEFILPINDFAMITVRNSSLSEADERSETVVLLRHFNSLKSEIIYKFDEIENIHISDDYNLKLLFSSYEGTILILKRKMMFRIALNEQVIFKIHPEIRKNARILYQAYTTDTLFSRLPIEIILDICCKTDTQIKNEKTFWKLAKKYFCRPLETSGEEK